MYQLIRWPALSALLLFAACAPFDPTTGGKEKPVEEKTLSELSVPDGFLFETTQSLNLRISAVNNAQTALANIPFRVLMQTDADSLPTLVFSGQTDENGLFEGPATLPKAAGKLFVETDFPGLPAVAVELNGQSSVQVMLGANNLVDDRSGYVAEPVRAFDPMEVNDRSTFSYLGAYDGQGLPNYLLPHGDVVSQAMLRMITATLPESKHVPDLHPEYIANNVQSNTVLTDSAEIWVTFVHEGASFRNALGYYTYPTGQAPQTPAAVGNLRIIFPNVSFSGSGGSLHTGDKVYLGKFPPGTTVAWFLVPDGWQPATLNVKDASYHPIHYSNYPLNTFATAPYQNHMVQLFDPASHTFLLGFEDVGRPGGDNDFNDAIFYVTSNPFNAVNRNNIAKTTTVDPDTDGDGVPDLSDEAPTDPTWAYRTYTPSATQMGTLAFEDFFPAKGDYDMNDVVVDYKFEERTNGAGKVAQIRMKWILRANGGSFHNGFGIELPVPWQTVTSVSGAQISEHYVQRNANGTETGQANAVVVLFDNGYNLLFNPGGGGLVNTEKNRVPVPTLQRECIITFGTPVNKTALGSAPYNPFIMVNQQRGREVHLPGKMPTSLADRTLFGTADDDTNLAANKSYVSTLRLPWAINVPVLLAYPAEKNPINSAFLKFNSWTENGGNTFKDWYLNSAGYRNAEKIY